MPCSNVYSQGSWTGPTSRLEHAAVPGRLVNSGVEVADVFPLCARPFRRTLDRRGLDHLARRGPLVDSGRCRRGDVCGPTSGGPLSPFLHGSVRQLLGQSGLAASDIAKKTEVECIQQHGRESPGAWHGAHWHRRYPRSRLVRRRHAGGDLRA